MKSLRQISLLFVCLLAVCVCARQVKGQAATSAKSDTKAKTAPAVASREPNAPVVSGKAVVADPNASTVTDPNEVGVSDKTAVADPNKPAGADEPGKGDEKKPKESKEDTGEAINLNNVEMKVIIQKLGDWTGKPIIPTTEDVMKKKITIYFNQKVPRPVALSLIYAAMRTQGIIAEDVGDKIFLKPITQARQGYVPMLSDADPLERFEDKSQVVEKFFSLENYSPSRLLEVVSPMIAEYGHITALESSGEIIIIDTVESLMRIEKIIRQLDAVESGQVVEEIFEIKNADPVEIIQVLELILKDASSGGRGGRSSGASKPKPQPKPKPSSSKSSSSGSGAKSAPSVTIESIAIPIKLIPMPKQSWIIARASAEDMDLIASWIEKLDIPEAIQPGQTVVPVRYVDPREVASSVKRALRDLPGSELETNIVIEALSQSKQIIIFGSAENRKMIEMLIAQIDLPSDDLFVEKTFKLEHADPDQIKLNIEGLYESQGGSQRSYTYSRGRYSSRYSSVRPEDVVKAISFPTTKQVTVIASEENMKKISKQIEEEWDIPLDIEKDQFRIITLRNSDPVQMADLLSRLFSADAESSSSNFFRYIFGRGDEDDKKKIVGSLYGLLTFEPVPNTKKIIVISKIPQAYDVIERLIERLDSQEKAEVPKVITLNYADAEDLCDQLNAILNEPGTTATLRRASKGLSEYSAESGSSGAGQEEDSAGTITPWWNRQIRTADTEMPTSNLIGKVRFIPVHRSKAILVLAPREYMEDVEAMIAELDKPGMQVMIKVHIVEIDHRRMTSLGVQLTSSPTLFNALGENALTALTELIHNDRYGQTTATYKLNVTALIDLLVKNADARVLNQPTLWTKDNKEAVFIKGKEIAFLDQSQTDATGSIKQTFNYRDVGVTLRVRPNITPEKAVDMTINLTISEVGAEDINNQVSINKLDTTTNIIVNDGQTILLGGILFRNDSTIQRKVPLLGDIPIVGEVFKHTETQARNNELLAFVTPYVIDAESLEEIPADTDTMEQIEEPRRRMEDIISQLNAAIEKAIKQDQSHSGEGSRTNNRPADSVSDSADKSEAVR